MNLEEQLDKLRADYKKTGDPVKREVILRQVRALEIANNKELISPKDVQD